MRKFILLLIFAVLLLVHANTASAQIQIGTVKRVTVQTQFSVENIAGRRFVYNFGNPFSGTHFGYPRRWSERLRLTFH